MTVEKVGKLYRFRASDSSVDCEGEVILLSSWNAIEKLHSVPAYVNHDKTKKVGTAKPFIRDGELIVDFDLTDEETKARVDSGALVKCSAGFDRVESEKTASGLLVTTKATLREVSLVPEGCNYNAVRINKMSEKKEESPSSAPSCKCKDKAEKCEGDHSDLLNMIPAMVKAAMESATADLKSQLSSLTAERDAALVKIASLEAPPPVEEEEEEVEEPVKIKLTALDRKSLAESVKTALAEAVKKEVQTVINYHTGRLN